MFAIAFRQACHNGQGGLAVSVVKAWALMAYNRDNIAQGYLIWKSYGHA
jgi:hypothetical protein